MTDAQGGGEHRPPATPITPRTPLNFSRTASYMSMPVSEGQSNDAPGERAPLLEGERRDVEEGSGQYGTGQDKGKRPLRRKKNVWAKVKYYVPSTAWIPDYSLSLLGGDFLGAITVACILVPQSVSYATSLGKLSPVAGLFSASIPGIVYALLGTSRHLNVAPEAALSLLVGQAITEIVRGDPHWQPEHPEAMKIAISTIITFQVGLISFLLGFFRLGFIDVVLSRALLRGFITAVAIVIMIEQLIPMFGLVELEHNMNPQSTLNKLIFLVENMFSHGHRPTAFISFGSLGVLIGMRWFKSFFPKYWWIYRLPEVLVVVVLSTVLSEQLHWNAAGVDILGSVNVNTGKHFFNLPFRHRNLNWLTTTTSTAVLISVIGFLDSIVAAKQNASRFGYSVSPNRELVALGTANLIGSFVPGTLPAFGSITRSRINGDVGGRTQMASLMCSGLVLLSTYYLLPLLFYLPTCVLASIVAMIVFSLLAETPHDVMYYWKMRSWADLGLMFLTFILTILWNVEIGVVVSLVISLLMVVHRSAKPRMTILGRLPGTDTWKPLSENPEAKEDVPGVLIVRIRENLDFANTAQLKERLRRLELYGVDPSHPSEEPRRQPASILVFHMADVESCDASAVAIFCELLQTYKNHDVGLFVTHLRSGPRAMFEKAGVTELLGEDAFYDNVGTAMASIARRYHVA